MFRAQPRTRQSYLDCYRDAVFKSSVEWGWKDLTVNHDFFDPFARPTLRYSEHHICINIGKKAGRLHIASASEKFQGLIRPHEFLVTPAGQEVGWDLLDKAEALSIRLQPHLVNRCMESLGVNSDLVEILHAVKKKNARIHQCAQWLLEELHTGNVRGRLFAEGMAHVLASELVFSVSSDGVSKTVARTDPSDQKLEEVLTYIMHEYDSLITIEKMAARAHLSVFHFCRWFKKKKGVSPYRFVINIKMNKAQMLLRDKNRKLPISQIAGLLGYKDVNYFFRVFKKYVGVTPNEFRDRS
jgi:AraC family transcriptional regulator